MLPHLLLVTALAVPASAQTLPDCIHVSTTSARYKASLDAVRDCQEKARQKLIDTAQDKGQPLSYQRLEQIDDEQRAQVREFLAMSGTIIEGATKSDRALGADPEIDGLEKRLRAEAGDGKDGISPAIGRDVIDSLTKKQGFVSADMRDLLDSVVRDGGRLTPETMKKLQDAGRAAKGASLNLNIDKGVEKELIERDFDKDAGEKPETHADPGNL